MLRLIFILAIAVDPAFAAISDCSQFLMVTTTPKSHDEAVARTYQRLLTDQGSEVVSIADLKKLYAAGAEHFEALFEIETNFNSSRNLIQEGLRLIHKIASQTTDPEALKNRLLRILADIIHESTKNESAQQAQVHSRQYVASSLYTLKLSGYRVRRSAFSANSKYLAISTEFEDKLKTEIWDLSQNRPIRTKSFNYAVGNMWTYTKVGVSNDGEKVFFQEDTEISVVDGSDGHKLDSLPTANGNFSSRFAHFVFSQDGVLLATITQSGLLVVREAASLKPIKTIDSSIVDDESVCIFTPDGSGMIVRHRDSVSLWNFQTNIFTDLIQSHGKQLHSAAYSNDGSLLSLGIGTDIVVLRTSDYQEIRKLEFGAAIVSTGFTEDRNYIYIGLPNTKVFLEPIDPAGVKMLPFEIPGRDLIPAISPDGRWFYRGNRALFDTSFLLSGGDL